MKIYQAPWGASLIVLTSVATAILVAVAIGVGGYGQGLAGLAGLLPLALIGGAALFTIRGYSVSFDAVSVQRLVWTTRLPLAGLQSVRFEPEAMRRSIRLFGNGGLFSFTGLFRNKTLGSYRAFVTDLHRTVVLRFPGRTVVLSPSDPEDFVREINVARRVA